ncbi:transposase [Streptomyces sp. NPDC005262]|uniref:transposase n=1 Tax=Streptomyces sp. NPDC005262 TaxID=3364710 RepID=UPI0036C3E608
MGRGDLADGEWARLLPFLPVSNRRCGRWRDHRQLIDGILHRVRTGVPGRELPERLGPWKTVYERHRLWSADGTWGRLLQQVQTEADAAGEIDWTSRSTRPSSGPHQHAAGARTGPCGVDASGTVFHFPVALGVAGEDRFAKRIQCILLTLLERREVRPSARFH